MGHLTVKIKYKKATNESTIIIEQGNLTADEYARAITAINDYLVACVTEHAKKLHSSHEAATSRFILPTSFAPVYEFPTVHGDPHDITHDLFNIFAAPRMSDIGISISTQHEMELSSESGTGGKLVLHRSPRHGHAMLSAHTFDAEEPGLDEDYEIAKSRFTITVTQGGLAVMIQFPKLLPPAKPFSEARGQLLLEVLFQHLAKYKPIACDLDQVEDATTHVTECRSGKVTLKEPILPVDFKRIITNLTQLVDVEDKKIDERNKARGKAMAKPNATAGTELTGKQHRKMATAGRPTELVVAPIVATPMDMQTELQPKRMWSCFPCW